MRLAIVAVFLVTYALIAARRLALLPIGRPAGALLGAVAMVAIGALSPEESFAAIDHDTLALLLGMMLLSAYLARAGLFDRLTELLLRRFATPRRLLVAIAGLSGVLSAFLVNDTVCLFMTPLVVALCRRGGLPYPPFLLALATSANIGSAATLVGNPQNMIIGAMSGLGFVEFLAAAGPAAALGLAVNIGLLLVYYGRTLPPTLAVVPADPPPEAADRREVWTTGAVTLAIILGFFLGLHPGYTVLGGVIVLMLRDRRDPHEVFTRVDWPLLLFFTGLFIVVAGLRASGLVDAAWVALRPACELDAPAGIAAFTGLVSAGANLVSNVPLVLILGPNVDSLAAGPLPWVLLGFVSTVAGNLTLLGSVANIIVAEGAREVHELGFFEYLRFGALSTVVVLAIGVLAIVLI
ncbi:MAG: hypothetical protein H6710_05030 [Myxococcales bacterium]|nr:hypothetical protein [Myxococcales bacterium]MCB9705585.1 hypothetical protein [Myxococcales bacterium]